MTIRSRVAARPGLYFLALALLLSWYPWALALLRVEGARGGMNPLGVLLAALLVSGMAWGWSGVKEQLARIVRWRVPLRWYAAVFLIPLAVGGVSLAANLALGAAAPDPAAWTGWIGLLDAFLIGLLFIGLGEEPGWRGFLLARVQRRHPPLRAALLVGAVWAGWHIPMMGAELPLALVPAFLIVVLAASVVIGWVFNGARGSSLLCMLLHAAQHALLPGFFFRMFQGDDLTRMWWISAAAWALAAGIVLLATRGSLAAPVTPRATAQGLREAQSQA
jgi:membrane protease YdiL (CAAX protease family)